MSEIFSHILALHSAPAICGIKASNLISCSTNDISSLMEDIEEVNKKYNPIVYIKILQINDDRVLILVYRKSILESALLDSNKKSFLNDCGYPCTNNLDALLNHLEYRLNNSSSFPHEIEIFLGYDLSDVLGFINHRKCIYSGLWKIYSDKENKIKMFDKFNKCAKRVLQYVDKGYTLDSFMK